METVNARKLARKQPSRKKKGGMVTISENVQLVGFGDEGCVFYDNGEYYKMITPKYKDNKKQEPSEVAFVKDVKNLNLDTKTLVYPYEYHKVPIEEVQNAVNACPSLHSTIRNFNIQEIYIGNINFAGESLANLIHDKNVRKLNNDEVVSVLNQLETMLVHLKLNKIVHHDIHPGNITFTGLTATPGNRDIQVHLIDFGLAEVLKDKRKAKGSPSHSSPNKSSPSDDSPSKGSPSEIVPITDEESMISKVLPALRGLIDNNRIKRAIKPKMQTGFSQLLQNVVEIIRQESSVSSTSNDSQGRKRKRKLKMYSSSPSVSPFNLPQAASPQQQPQSEQDPFSPLQPPQRDFESVRNLTSKFSSQSLSKGGSKTKKAIKTHPKK